MRVKFASGRTRVSPAISMELPADSRGRQLWPAEEPGDRSSVYLHPGQIFASTEPCVVTTILGSCVAVCLWDPSTGVGGANHYLLPYEAKEGQASARFGNVAVRGLIDKLLALGAVRRNLQAKIFGGACVLEAFRSRDTHLGMTNIQVARKLMSDEGISITAEDVGGSHARKLRFHTEDGSAWVKSL